VHVVAAYTHRNNVPRKCKDTIYKFANGKSTCAGQMKNIAEGIGDPLILKRNADIMRDFYKNTEGETYSRLIQGDLHSSNRSRVQDNSHFVRPYTARP
jgi:hypothetical protein